MPTTATDTDAFPSTVQRPNNGELADAASLSQGFNPVTQRTRYLLNRGRSALFDITRPPYSADPTGVADSTAGMQAAIDAAAAAGGHVFSPGGIFLHTQLTVPDGVSLFGVPGKTFWLHNHASADALVLSGTAASNPITIEDIQFIANVATTGNVVSPSAAARAQ